MDPVANRPARNRRPASTLLAERQLDIFELISRGTTLDVVLRQIVSLAEAEFDPIAVSIDLVDAGAGGLRAIASSKFPTDYAAAIASIAPPDLDLAAESGTEADRIAECIRKVSLAQGMPDCLPSTLR